MNFNGVVVFATAIVGAMNMVQSSKVDNWTPEIGIYLVLVCFVN